MLEVSITVSENFILPLVSDLWSIYLSLFQKKSLAMFQHDSSCMALLMDGSAALGLDLSFVTHVFLMEPIWDRRLIHQTKLICKQGYQIRILLLLRLRDKLISRNFKFTLFIFLSTRKCSEISTNLLP